MKVDTALFGRLSNREEAQLFTLQNSQGITVKLTNFGGIIISVLVPDRKDKLLDVVRGFDSLEGYLGQHPYIGTLVGRYANRIGNAKFILDGKEYRLVQNAGKNHLHGGLKGYDKVLWNYSQYADLDRAGIMMSYRSFDMEEGYPGNLKLDVHFSLNESNELTIEYSATTDKNTYLNLTHHGYFIDREKEGPKLAAIVYHPTSDRKMEIYTTEPAIQFYSSNFLTGLKGKGNIKYRKHLALCLEAQHYPDSPNHPHFPSTLLQHDEIYRKTTVHKFYVE